MWLGLWLWLRLRPKLWPMLRLHSAQKQASLSAASRGPEQPSFQLGTEASRTGPGGSHWRAWSSFLNHPQNHYKLICHFEFSLERTPRII